VFAQFSIKAVGKAPDVLLTDNWLSQCKRVTVLERRDGDVLALACRGVSAALSARYKSGLEARREQHELILLHPHPTVPSYTATNPLTV
jgi:hypothetical protein